MFDLQLAVKIPGGLPFEKSIERLVTFKPINGELEQALSYVGNLGNRPAMVTKILTLALDNIGKVKITEEVVSSLCVADRQFLMLQLATLLEGDHMWLQVDCGHCNETFDVDLKRSELPIKLSGDAYPSQRLKLKNYELNVRILNGLDQERLIESGDDDLVRQALYYCLSQTDGSTVSKSFIEDLTDEEIIFLDETLDEIAPAICDQLEVRCPECQRVQMALIDHYETARIDPVSFFSEVHQIASQYHWSEREILKLPRSKRRLYLRLVSQSQGMME